MTMTIDANQQRYGALNFDHMSPYQNQPPHFTNPWASSTSAPAPPQPNATHGGLFIETGTNGGLPHLNLSGLSKHPQHPHPQQHQHAASRGPSTTSYGSVPVTASSAGSSHPAAMDMYGQKGSLPATQDLLSINRLQHPTTSAAYADTSYTTAAPVPATYAPSGPYEHIDYAPPPPMRSAYPLGPEADQARRYSQPGMQQPPSIPHDDRRSFQDALEASHGMLSMSQETPRNIYDVRNNRGRGSADSYGFPSSHSSASSISSTGFSGYYGGSVDSAISDYSTGGSDIESLSGRTLPRPHGLMAHQMPPAPQSMMGQFSSKIASSTQKKHKCKVCDKRFTRPSSLQTHMYSHTGEKPFACEVEGCGRHFSVVSNLRRHRKVHKGQTEETTPSEADSEDHQSEQSED
jgi:hypothetical protein